MCIANEMRKFVRLFFISKRYEVDESYISFVVDPAGLCHIHLAAIAYVGIEIEDIYEKYLVSPNGENIRNWFHSIRAKYPAMFMFGIRAKSPAMFSMKQDNDFLILDQDIKRFVPMFSSYCTTEIQ